MIIPFILLFFSFTFVDSGAVGECRSECVEQNLYKIVRVHLKEDLVMVGICKNTSVSIGSLSTVIPFVCHRKHGIWKLDNAVSSVGLLSSPPRAVAAHVDQREICHHTILIPGWWRILVLVYS
ncbi:unnamed protein product [Angiostrongylus costaricensis]|uniref:Secreted protein n=1 Tax=Angiostrongylus costaricensis TaxID=334426 RepID=A0A0R3PKT7_ANGCS|nr:unnamed protein product [Angiostrongylus costaricensis]